MAKVIVMVKLKVMKCTLFESDKVERREGLSLGGIYKVCRSIRLLCAKACDSIGVAIVY